MALHPAGTDTPHMNFTGEVRGVEGGSRGHGARGARFSSGRLHHSPPLLQGPARQAGGLPAPRMASGMESHTNTHRPSENTC